MLGVWAAIKGATTATSALMSPTVWKIVAIVVAFVAVYGYADRKATYRERAACEAAAQRAQKAADAQDAKAERELRIKAEAVVEQLSTQKVADDAILEDLKVKLAARPLSAPCYYPDVAPTGRVRSPVPGKGTRN